MYWIDQFGNIWGSNGEKPELIHALVQPHPKKIK